MPGVAWFTATRPEGGPHITPLVFVWHEGAPWLCTGPEEQKARSLAADPRCALLTGTDELHEGSTSSSRGHRRTRDGHRSVA